MNTHRLDGDIIHVFQLLQTDFNWDPRVRIEHVADEPVHLREMQIICREKDSAITVISESASLFHKLKCQV
jgi:hypothetical protein